MQVCVSSQPVAYGCLPRLYLADLRVFHFQRLHLQASLDAICTDTRLHATRARKPVQLSKDSLNASAHARACSMLMQLSAAA